MTWFRSSPIEPEAAREETRVSTKQPNHSVHISCLLSAVMLLVSDTGAYCKISFLVQELDLCY